MLQIPKALKGSRCFALLMCAAIFGGAHAAEAAPASYPYKVTTTTGMVTDLVRNVGGDKAVVAGIMGSGVDPHLYKATRDDVAAMLSADLVFYSGLMLEGKMSDALIKVARNKPVHAVTQLIDEKYLLEPEEFAGHSDPHVWMDPIAWSKGAEVVAKALAEFDPANKDYYLSNSIKFIEQANALHEYGKKVLATVPQQTRVLITSHDAFNYFGRAYSLKVIGVQGISTESEAGLQRINDLVDFLVANRVPAVFIESSVSPKNIQALVDGTKSRGHNVRIGGQLFSDAMGEEGTYEGTYIGMIDHNVTLVARSLGGTAPERGMQGKLRDAH